MFWKDQLASELLTSDVNSIDLFALQKKYHSLRVKSIDRYGEVFLIQLESRGEWLKPLEWARNHMISLFQRLEESAERVLSLGDDLIIREDLRLKLTKVDILIANDLRIDGESGDSSSVVESLSSSHEKLSELEAKLSDVESKLALTLTKKKREDQLLLDLIDLANHVDLEWFPEHYDSIPIIDPGYDYIRKLVSRLNGIK